MVYKITSFLFLFLTLYLIYPIESNSLFSIQETLTILCHQFPLITATNNTDLQCARLRINEDIPTAEFKLDRPTEIILLIIIDQSFTELSHVNITINFDQSLNSPSSISKIRFVLVVPHSSFTINNQTTKQYTPYDLPIFLWENSTENTYNTIDLLHFQNYAYETDTSLCKWDMNQWNRLFNDNMFNNVSYVYFLKTTNSQLIFTLVDTSNKSSLLLPPSPYLNILYCIPYKLGTTELVLIVCFGIFFIIITIILSVVHCLKGGISRQQLFEHYQNQGIDNKSFGNHSEDLRNRSEDLRYRAPTSVSAFENNDLNT